MKIGILTLPFNNNYGGYLQCYALLTVLKSMGHDVVVINRRMNYIKYNFRIAVSVFIKRFLLRKKFIYNTSIREKKFADQGRNMMTFVKENIQPMTKAIYSHKEMLKLNKMGFDVIIVGSDQVWRPKYVPNIEDYFLDFTKGWNIKRISYAASFGTNLIEYSDIELDKCSDLLKDFDAISVREESAKTLIKENFKFATNLVIKSNVDPTLLLKKENYEKFIATKNISQQYLFCYILDDFHSKRNDLEKISKQLNCELKYISIEECVLPSIEDWLTLIYNSKYVITDSFHGTIFSIIFHKNFISICNKNRGEGRFIDLLKKYHLSDNLIHNVSCNNYNDIVVALEKRINWKKIDSSICEDIKSSFIYLKENLTTRS